MKWSKLKSLVEERFADSLGKRITINSTRYGNCSCGRAWITVDKEEIANFCTRAHFNNKAGIPPSEDAKSNFEKMPVGYGELSRQDAYQSCFEYIHSLTLDQAILDEDPLIQTLAILDKKLGRKKMMTLDRAHLHPMALKLLEVRLVCEGLSEKK
ncbi:MAG: hypothetical protein AB7F75_09140 [Planctomycetota bacterium]